MCMHEINCAKGLHFHDLLTNSKGTDKNAGAIVVEVQKQKRGKKMKHRCWGSNPGHRREYLPLYTTTTSMLF